MLIDTKNQHGVSTCSYSSSRYDAFSSFGWALDRRLGDVSTRLRDPSNRGNVINHGWRDTASSLPHCGPRACKFWLHTIVERNLINSLNKPGPELANLAAVRGVPFVDRSDPRSQIIQYTVYCLDYCVIQRCIYRRCLKIIHRIQKTVFDAVSIQE